MAPSSTAIVRNSLLALLSEVPKYGPQLREDFEAGTGYVWPLNSGQVYMISPQCVDLGFSCAGAVGKTVA
jgi:hypothetical protein